MNNIIKRVWNQNRMVNIEALSGMAFQAEDGGHTFEISGINDANEAVSLSGTVAGVFMRPDGTDVALTGTASDGVVSVTLSDACYAVAGRFGLYIFVTSDSKKTCVYACIGSVTQTSYGTVAGDTPQNVVDLINAINAAVATIPADYTDLMAAVAPTYSNSALYAKGAYAWYNGVLYKAVVDITTAESFTAAHWAAADLGDDVADLMSAVDDIYNNLIRFNVISPYLYKKDTYINASLVETTLSGYDTFKIPCKEGEFVYFVWSDSVAPWNGITSSVIVAWENESGTLARGLDGLHLFINTTVKEAIFIAPANCAYVYFTFKRTQVSDVTLKKNYPYNDFNDEDYKRNFVVPINGMSAIKAKAYLRLTGTIYVFNNDSYAVWWIPVKNGDTIKFKSTTITGLTMVAAFKSSNNTVTNIYTAEYTFNDDGIVSVFDLADNIGNATLYPKTQLQVDAKNVVGTESNFGGLNGVAFGTSLTYRAISSYGYLTRLAGLSGITFDNQGVGSSTILGDGGDLDMLAKIKAYTGYSGKRVAVLEGFVNDWYTQKTLGTWKDTGETTVCGCVRSALNYMLSQNANLTVFLILDHYGRINNSVDCSSTATRNGYTQYEYYEEIAKVAKSLGVPVIKEYEVSQISENTPQYLADNIHLNALGAEQSAYAIWSQMKAYYPNRT